MEPTMDCAELAARLGDEELLVLDCRSREDLEGFGLRIPGALHMGYEELLSGSHILPDDELIVLCGAAPGDRDGRQACRLLQMRGRRAVVLEGGLRAWVSQGYPTEIQLLDVRIA